MNTAYKHELCNSWDDYGRCPAPIHTYNMMERGAISCHSLHYLFHDNFSSIQIASSVQQGAASLMVTAKLS